MTLPIDLELLKFTGIGFYYILSSNNIKYIHVEESPIYLEISYKVSSGIHLTKDVTTKLESYLLENLKIKYTKTDLCILNSIKVFRLVNNHLHLRVSLPKRDYASCRFILTGKHNAFPCISSYTFSTTASRIFQILQVTNATKKILYSYNRSNDMQSKIKEPVSDDKEKMVSSKDRGIKTPIINTITNKIKKDLLYSNEELIIDEDSVDTEDDISLFSKTEDTKQNVTNGKSNIASLIHEDTKQDIVSGNLNTFSLSHEESNNNNNNRFLIKANTSTSLNIQQEVRFKVAELIIKQIGPDNYPPDTKTNFWISEDNIKEIDYRYIMIERKSVEQFILEISNFNNPFSFLLNYDKISSELERMRYETVKSKNYTLSNKNYTDTLLKVETDWKELDEPPQDIPIFKLEYSSIRKCTKIGVSIAYLNSLKRINKKRHIDLTSERSEESIGHSKRTRVNDQSSESCAIIQYSAFHINSLLSRLFENEKTNDVKSQIEESMKLSMNIVKHTSIILGHNYGIIKKI